MNQDQIKTLLLKLNPDVPDFSVVMTGKESRKVDGLYKPELRQILLHNRNFKSDEQLIYTAIHEFAHHVHFSGANPPSSLRAHTTSFWNIFHRLLDLAERQGLYRNVFTAEPEFISLTQRIKSEFVSRNGELMKDLGQVLQQAVELCKKFQVNFEDYLDRVLGVNRVTAKTVLTAFNQNLPAEVGYEKMKYLTSFKKPEDREAIVERWSEGATMEMVKAEIKPVGPEKRWPPEAERPLDKLQAEKKKLEVELNSTLEKLRLIDQRIAELSQTGEF